RVHFVDSNRATNVTAGFSFHAQVSLTDREVQPAAVRSSIQLFVTAYTAAAVKAEKDRADESHHGAFAGLVRTVENVQARFERIPGSIIPDTKTIDVNILDFHESRRRSPPSVPARSIHSLSRASSGGESSLRLKS